MSLEDVYNRGLRQLDDYYKPHKVKTIKELHTTPIGKEKLKRGRPPKIQEDD